MTSQSHAIRSQGLKIVKLVIFMPSIFLNVRVRVILQMFQHQLIIEKWRFRHYIRHSTISQSRAISPQFVASWNHRI